MPAGDDPATRGAGGKGSASHVVVRVLNAEEGGGSARKDAERLPPPPPPPRLTPRWPGLPGNDSPAGGDSDRRCAEFGVCQRMNEGIGDVKLRHAADSGKVARSSNLKAQP